MEDKMSYKYKVKQDEEGNALIPDGTTLPNFGVIHNGLIESNTVIENPNLELVGQDPAPNHLNGVVPQSAQVVTPTTESEGQQ